MTRLLRQRAPGYARRGRKIAVSPIAALPVKRLFHEVGHVTPGHTDKGDLADTEQTPRDLREMEAEAVARLCCESLDLPGAEYSRDYIQSWGQGQTFTERSAQRIFHMTLQEIAKAVGIHPVHLAREFHRRFGRTIGEQIRFLRIEYASRILAYGRPLAEVALAAGFSDQSHLSKTFLSLVGSPPGQFRRDFILANPQQKR